MPQLAFECLAEAFGLDFVVCGDCEIAQGKADCHGGRVN